jgi:6-phosphogluconate dehydrogenase
MSDQEHEHEQTCDIGLVGLGVMGRNFARNLADKGFTVAGYDRGAVELEELEKRGTRGRAIRIASDMASLCALVRRPRAVMMLVPAGDPVDAVIQALEPQLDKGDLIIDSGNSHFSDTDRRSQALAQKGIVFMGMGMSGGASGARHGPSLMPGGPQENYGRIRAILEAAAAHVGTTPCVAWLGPGSAGHYVKMVHNGIEYGLMQLIAETYDLMKRGLGLHPPELHAIYRRWHQGALNSYLMEITAEIFLQTDERTGRPLIDMILDRAKQKGTGEWTVADALTLQVPVPNIDAAVMMRHLSGSTEQRTALQRFEQAPAAFADDRPQFIDRLENALYAATIATYAQGLDLLKQASRSHGYGLNLETVARVWSGGCIIRARLLEEIQAAFSQDPDLVHLLAAPSLNAVVRKLLTDLRLVVRTAADLGIPVPGLMVALAYLDACHGGWLPANLIMAQRDYFGSHTYERVDAQGTFHTQWERK